MILVSVSKQKDGTLSINRWVKEPKTKKFFSGHSVDKEQKLKRTHEAVVDFVTDEQIKQFYVNPPERLLLK